MYDEPCVYYTAPPISQAFLKGLEKIGGLTPTGKPRFQCVWGMDELWIRNGEWVPRYVNSKELVVIEHQSEDQIVVGVQHVMKYYGKPRWIIQEWRDPARLLGATLEEAERDWEQNWRYQVQIGAGTDDAGNPVPVVEKIDRMGPFPRDFYIYVCTLETNDGAYAQPSEFWLDVIRESIHRRDNRKFVSAEAEIRELQQKLRADRQAVSDRVYDEMMDELKIHAHRLENPARANKGGQRPDRVILSGTPFNKS